jgi:hypothetical protein
MYDKQLRAIRLFLDAIPGEIDDSADNQLCMDLVEEAGISILDSRFMEFAEGLLEEFLLDYLRVRQYEYGLIDVNCPVPVER